MERIHCMADAKHIRRFLDCCEGNWHQCVYVRCVSCKTPGYCRQPDFLYHPDPEGKPCVLLMRDARLLFARLPEPTECAGALTMEIFRGIPEKNTLNDGNGGSGIFVRTAIGV